MPAPALTTDARSRLLGELREADIDRYLALLLMPEGVRDDLLALFLFNAEIASIRDKVRDALPGEVRLQWWREVLSGERDGEAQAHPVASMLRGVIDHRAMPVAPLIAMCDARIFDLYDDPMPDRTSSPGLRIAPAASTTSRPSTRSIVPCGVSTSTPVQRPPFSSARRTSVPARISRFGLARAGAR